MPEERRLRFSLRLGRILGPLGQKTKVNNRDITLRCTSGVLAPSNYQKNLNRAG